MTLSDLSKPVDSARILELIRSQFATKYNLSRLGLTESTNVLTKTNTLIARLKQKSNIHESQHSVAYTKLIMLKEAVNRHISELADVQPKQETKMNTKFTQALKAVAQGKQLRESHIRSLRLSESMQTVLRSPASARAFMKKIVESKKSKLLTEGEIDQAQTTIAAQDIADRIQQMIGKFADIKYKELPALHDSIRNSYGIDAAKQFNEQLIGSLGSITDALESAKVDVDNAVAVLTGQEVAGELDLDLDGLESDEDDAEHEVDTDSDEDEFDLDFEEEDEDEANIGRERR